MPKSFTRHFKVDYKSNCHEVSMIFEAKVEITPQNIISLNNLLKSALNQWKGSQKRLVISIDIGNSDRLLIERFLEEFEKKCIQRLFDKSIKTRIYVL